MNCDCIKNLEEKLKDGEFEGKIYKDVRIWHFHFLIILLPGCQFLLNTRNRRKTEQI